MVSNYTSFIIDLSKTNRALLTTEKDYLLIFIKHITTLCYRSIWHTITFTQPLFLFYIN